MNNWKDLIRKTEEQWQGTFTDTFESTYFPSVFDNFQNMLDKLEGSIDEGNTEDIEWIRNESTRLLKQLIGELGQMVDNFSQ